VHTRARARVAAVFGDEDADVVPLGGARDEGRLHVDDRRVAHRGAAVDHPAGPYLQGGDGDVVGRAVVHPSREVIDAGLRERRHGAREQHGKTEGTSHGAGPYRGPESENKKNLACQGPVGVRARSVPAGVVRAAGSNGPSAGRIARSAWDERADGVRPGRLRTRMPPVRHE
jgi:hypothetical protein